MSIPTSFDRNMAKLDNAHDCVMVAMRTLHHGSDSGGAKVRDMLKGYISAAMDILDGEEHARDRAQ
ncbi:hypothetical protein [Bradyrhizobium sp.]|jgi:hypothetical protein|uniref:hypothetical protein n=1 Tax=Bradyrhizobium sp. TaxID=376 RepID=UPI002C1D50CC|nr:hypothetical protein [Bradyrhizobium sp.]HWX61963.1 hypothetical protein [Bradyrhizobium sp.]